MLLSLLFILLLQFSLINEFDVSCDGGDFDAYLFFLSRCALDLKKLLFKMIILGNIIAVYFQNPSSRPEIGKHKSTMHIRELADSFLIVTYLNKHS